MSIPKTFSISFLNKVETASLLMLNVICFVNLIPAYSYAYPSYSFSYTAGVIETLRMTETALNLVFPFTALLVVALLVCIRMCHFICWLFQCIAKLIRFCTKYELI